MVTCNTFCDPGLSQSLRSDVGVIYADFSFIGGGVTNGIYGATSAIAGGNGNNVSSVSSFIGGGNFNLIQLNADCSVIAGGLSNNIGDSSGVTFDPATFSFIGGGNNNTIDSTGNPTTFGTIGGGQNNYIAPGTNHASIFGGNGNRVSGNCSAILGGSGNNDGGFANIGMYGNGLIGASIAGGLGGFFVNQLIMQNIAVGAAGYAGIPIGGLYTPVAPGSGYLLSPIYIK